MVGEFTIGGEYFHLVRKEFSLIGCELIPVFDAWWFWCQGGVGRHHPQCLLSGQGFFPQFVPALIEFAFVFIYPFFGHLVRGMGAAGSEIDEERFVGSEGLFVVHPLDGFPGHVWNEVIIGFIWRLNLSETIVEGGCPLVGFAAYEAVEFVEARSCGPAVGGTGGADFPGGRLV